MERPNQEGIQVFDDYSLRHYTGRNREDDQEGFEKEGEMIEEMLLKLGGAIFIGVSCGILGYKIDLPWWMAVMLSASGSLVWIILAGKLIKIGG